MILIDPPRSPLASRRNPLPQRELARFASRAIQAAGAVGSVAVLLTDNERIRALNRQFRKKDVPTDVLSFPAPEAAGRRSAGDLAISLDIAAHQAETLGHSLAVEVKILILHGALHLAGFDHEADDGEMARLEARLRQEFGLPCGLIQRSSDTAARVSRRTQTPVVSRRSKTPTLRGDRV